MILKKIINILTLVIWVTSYGQDKSYCELNVIDDVSRVNIDISEFTHVDTLFNEQQYNVIFICDNGTTILGNVDKKGIKNGQWLFYRHDSTGYEGQIRGSFEDGKMNGYWSNGPYSSLYKKGRHKTTTKIPF